MDGVRNHVAAVRAYPEPVSHPLERHAGLDGVAAAVGLAAAACARIPPLGDGLIAARRESGVRCAAAGSALDGVTWPLEAVRGVASGAGPVPDGPEGGVIRGALRVSAEVERLMPVGGGRGAEVPLGQLLARLHVAVGGPGPAGRGGPGAASALGRLRTDQPGDLRGLGTAPAAAEAAGRVAVLADLVAAPLPAEVPALVLAAVVHAELLAVRPFAWGNGAVARGVFRLMLAARGVDPGVVVPEVRWAGEPNVYLSAAAGFATGEPARVAAWLRYCSASVVDGAAEGALVAVALEGSGR